MTTKRLRDLMPKRPRYHQCLAPETEARALSVYRRLVSVPYIAKQTEKKWVERFCFAPDPERELAVWEWLAREYEQRTASEPDPREQNRIFKELLRQTIDYEPLGVRKIPE